MGSREIPTAREWDSIYCASPLLLNTVCDELTLDAPMHLPILKIGLITGP